MTTHKSEDYKVSAVNYYLTEDTTQEEVSRIFRRTFILIILAFDIKFIKKTINSFFILFFIEGCDNNGKITSSQFSLKS
jgi:hypothetical protein